MNLPHAVAFPRLQWAVAALGLLMAVGVCAAPVPQAPTQAPRGAQPVRTVLVIGDSLSAGYGMGADEGWVSLTAQRIARGKPGWRMVNASVSGETSAGGAARVVREVVRHRPDIVVVQLGANDGLRGLPLRQTRRNLAYIIGAAQGVHARVLLVGMRLPPNYGPEYTRAFERIYPDLARLLHTRYLPFLLQPIMRDRSAFQQDNMHPTARVQPLLRDHVWTVLGPMLDARSTPAALQGTTPERGALRMQSER